ncbi:LysR substrate-binding domain-containing protein [Thiocapsa marina]|uniref:Transcriptional regulator, LysR family n=1 Tax=Thiocapsa marina 5811 TaxID=768671 RepID=F9UHD4_9GAMM|nr:LysR substrate-binding domain-containing protein [Thiocapsa marina]EGV16392.1 transcriptional regulator, LysR family [Thiocapsa marina 5811]
MKLRQLEYFHEVIEQDFNISAAAKRLYTSQPGVSRQLIELADELGVELFLHEGKRLVGLTRAGMEIAEIAARMLIDVRRIHEIGRSLATDRHDCLKVVANRHAAHNLLHHAMVDFREMMPGIEVDVSEENTLQATAMLRIGQADLGLLAEAPDQDPDLLYFPIEEWRLLLVVPREHPLAGLPTVGLEDLAHYSVGSYDNAAQSRFVIDEAFAGAGLHSPVNISFASSHMILQFVNSKIGIAIVAESAFSADDYPELLGLDVTHLFRPLTTDLVLPRRTSPPRDVFNFLSILAPQITPTTIGEAIDS